MKRSTLIELRFARVDATIDDGDLGSGRFRLGENGRYTFIVDE